MRHGESERDNVSMSEAVNRFTGYGPSFVGHHVPVVSVQVLSVDESRCQVLFLKYCIL